MPYTTGLNYSDNDTYYEGRESRNVIRVSPYFGLGLDPNRFETISEQREYVRSLSNLTSTVILERQEGKEYKQLAEFSFNIPSSAFLETYPGADPETTRPTRTPYVASGGPENYEQFYTIPDDDIITNATHRIRIVDSYNKRFKGENDVLHIIDNDYQSLEEKEENELDKDLKKNIQGSFDGNDEEESLFGSLDYPAEDTLTTYLAGYTETGKAIAPVIENKEDGTKNNDSITGRVDKWTDSTPTDFGFNDLIYGYEGSDKLIGKAGADYLVGGEGNDKLIGGDGNDILIGNEGNDKFYDGNGDDLMFGGSGKDKFKVGKGANVIMDYEKGDKLKIRGVVAWAQEDFGLLGTYKNGTLALTGDSSELLELIG